MKYKIAIAVAIAIFMIILFIPFERCLTLEEVIPDHLIYVPGDPCLIPNPDHPDYVWESGEPCRITIVYEDTVCPHGSTHQTSIDAIIKSISEGFGSKPTTG